MGEGPLRVGYALPAKKLAKQRMEGFIQYAQSHGVEMHAISLDDDIDAQGPFDLLLHKVTDLMVADKGDARAASQLQALKVRFPSFGFASGQLTCCCSATWTRTRRCPCSIRLLPCGR